MEADRCLIVSGEHVALMHADLPQRLHTFSMKRKVWLYQRTLHTRHGDLLCKKKKEAQKVKMSIIF